MSTKGNSSKLAVTVVTEFGERKDTQVFEVNPMPYICATCHRVFKNNGALHTHMKAHQNTARPAGREVQHEYEGGRFSRKFPPMKGAVNKHYLYARGDYEQGSSGSSVTGGATAIEYARALPKDGSAVTRDTKTEEEEDGSFAVSGGESISRERVPEGTKATSNATSRRLLRKQQKCVCQTCGMLFESRGGLLLHAHEHGHLPEDDTTVTAKHPPSLEDPASSSLPTNQNLTIDQHQQRSSSTSTAVTVTQGDGIHLTADMVADLVAAREQRQWDERKRKRRKKKEKKVFECQVCEKLFQFKSRLERHMKTHDKDKNVLACSVCQKKMTHRRLLKHEGMCRQQNAKENDAQSARYTRSSSIINSSSSGGGVRFKCLHPHCCKVFDLQSDLQTHLQYHVQATTDVYKCDLCAKSFQCTETFSRHMALHCPVTGPKSLSCQICHKRFSKSYTLRHHVLTSHNQGDDGSGFACPSCNKLFSSKISFQLHLETHKTKQFRCNVCGWTLRHKSSFRKHMLMHQRRSFQCHVCKAVFVKRLHLTKHLKSHQKTATHPHTLPQQRVVVSKSKQAEDNHHASQNASRLNDYNEGTQQNDVVKPKLFAGEDLKSSSSSLPSSSLTCSICNKVLGSRMALRNHMPLHLGVKYKCDFCDKSFNRKYTLRAHLKTLHKKILCSNHNAQLAGGGLGLEGEVIKLHFSNQPLYKCPVCGFVYIHRKELLAHMRIHTGQKPYPCSRCPAEFHGRFQLQDHVTVRHPELIRRKRMRKPWQSCTK